MAGGLELDDLYGPFQPKLVYEKLVIVFGCSITWQYPLSFQLLP